MSAFYIVAGINHFVKPELYLPMMPPSLPFPLALVYLSGAAESGLGAALWVPGLRRRAAWGLIALLVAVFPANVRMFQLGGAAFGVPDWVLLWRLPFQLVFVAWAYVHTREER